MSESTSSPSQAISNVFECAIRVAVDDGSRDGCFLVNTALELAPHDQEVAELVANAFTEVENRFRALIERGQDLGEVCREVNPDSTARSLLSLMIGLRVLARSQPEEPRLRAIKYQAEVLLRLDPGPESEKRGEQDARPHGGDWRTAEEGLGCELRNCHPGNPPIHGRHRGGSEAIC